MKLLLVEVNYVVLVYYLNTVYALFKSPYC